VAWKTPTSSARSDKATRGGDCGGDAAARADNTAARLGYSGEVARAPPCTGSTTNGVGVQLTSGRRSWTASRRRGSGGGGESTAAAARVSGGAQGRQRRLGWENPGAAHGLNSPERSCRRRAGQGQHARASRTRRRRSTWPSVQPGHASGTKMTGGPRLAATAAREGNRVGWRRRSGPVGPLGCWATVRRKLGYSS
jgi:hypothetical protein